MHLGNAWSSLLAWLAARSVGGRVILRAEDIDPQRSRPEYLAELLADLRWLGLDWDEGPDIGGPSAPYLQSARGEIYRNAISSLSRLGLLYPCFCTRRELRHSASAPHAGEDVPPYPGKCRLISDHRRARLLAEGQPASLRIACHDEVFIFEDAVQGPQRFLLPGPGGDFVLQRSDGVVAYQLAVSVDDAMMGITQVVRGRDILPSTARQIFLQRLLGHHDVPEYAHIPLLLDSRGERLAKRHKSLTIQSLRHKGVLPQKIIGYLARLAGLLDRYEPVMPSELLKEFNFKRIPLTDIKVDEGIFER